MIIEWQSNVAAFAGAHVYFGLGVIDGPISVTSVGVPVTPIAVRGVCHRAHVKIAGNWAPKHRGHDSIEVDFADVEHAAHEGVVVWSVGHSAHEIVRQYFKQAQPGHESIEGLSAEVEHGGHESIEQAAYADVQHRAVEGVVTRLFRQALAAREQIVTAVEYRLYKNTADGGDVDLATPFQTSATTTFVTVELPSDFHHRFIVRRFNGIYEDRNLAEIHLRIDAGGNADDLLPGVPIFDGKPAGDFEIDIYGEYRPDTGEGVEPDTFELYWDAGTGGGVSFATAISSQTLAVNDKTNVASFHYRRTGLTPGTTYDFVLRTQVAGGADSGNTAVISVTVPAVPPPVTAGAAEFNEGA